MTVSIQASGFDQEKYLAMPPVRIRPRALEALLRYRSDIPGSRGFDFVRIYSVDRFFPLIFINWPQGYFVHMHQVEIAGIGAEAHLYAAAAQLAVPDPGIGRGRVFSRVRQGAKCQEPDAELR